MSLLFCDGFDHYGQNGADTQLELKYSSVSGSNAKIDLTGTLSRTGIGCLVILDATGPTKNFANQTSLVWGSAFYIAGLPSGFLANIVGFFDPTGGTRQLRLTYGGDGSIHVLAGNDPFPTDLGRTAGGVVKAGIYQYIECKFQISHSASVIVRVNEQTVLTLTGVNTNPATQSGTTGMQLMGTGGLGGDRHDDMYLLINDGSGNTDFLGAVRIPGFLPTGDSSPLQWTPSTAGTHWTLVNAVPATTAPPPDVSSSTVGQVDQYVYNPGALIAAPSVLLGAQHILLGQLDSAGGHTITSDVSGVAASGGQGLTTSPNMLLWEYDTNPSTGQPWKASDFPGTVFGPELVS